jgi:Zn-dependent peptidase ImmA (M78 family)/transcriptional regulator with XRE-family HTH domain
MDQATLGRRLREARDDVHITQQHAAETIDAPRTAVTQIEAGNRSVSTLELARLAALYRRPVAWFLREVDADEAEDLFVVLHRSSPGLEDDPELRRQVDQLVLMCREGVALERILGRPARPRPPAFEVSVPRSAGEAVAQGEETAEQERQRLGTAAHPIADMAELLTAQSIWASGVELPDDVSGLFLHHSDVGMAILVNSYHVRARKRFSYAHEYAHALLDRSRRVTVSTRENAPDLIEKRANAFAAAFLMPTEGVLTVLHSLGKGQPSRQEKLVYDAATGGRIEAELRPPARSQAIGYQDAAAIAHHFGVSYQAAVYRLRSLNHLSHNECQSLLSQEALGRDYLQMLGLLGDLDEREEAARSPRELRNQLAHLCLEAYRREEISRGKVLDLAKLLGISGRQLLELAEATRAA